jgi:hypothetical protein
MSQNVEFFFFIIAIPFFFSFQVNNSMISKQLVYTAGIELHVFGLEEYKNLPTGTPLCAMFFCTLAQCNYFKLNVKIKKN